MLIKTSLLAKTIKLYSKLLIKKQSKFVITLALKNSNNTVSVTFSHFKTIIKSLVRMSLGLNTFFS